MSTVVDDFVSDSKVYKNVLADSMILEDRSYLTYSYESIIKVVDAIDGIYLDLQGAKIDKGIRFEDADMDDSHYMYSLMLMVAHLCSGPMAHDTLSLYMYDSELRQCQLYVAENFPAFFNQIADKATIFPETATYLAMVS